MKTRLLLVLMLTSVAPVLFAQNSLLVSDSTYFNYNDKLAQKPYVYTQILYNPACLDSVNEVNYPASPAQSRRVLSSYYPNGNPYQRVQQSYDTTTQAFVTKNRSTYAYTATGQIQNITDEAPDGTGWKPAGLGTYSYDAAGRDTLYLYKIWDAAQQAYVNNSETVNSYDAAGRVILTEYRDWDAAAGVWVPYFGFYSAYDSRGYQVSYSVGATNYLTNIYQIIFRQVSYINSTGLADSSYKTEDREFYSDSVRYYFTYYPSSKYEKTVTTYNYDENRVYQNGTFSTFFYDSSGYSRLDSAITRNFTTTPGQLNPGSSLQVRFYDSANYVTRDSILSKYSPDTPENAYPVFSETTVHAFNEYKQEVMFTINQISYSGGGFVSFREDDSKYTLCSPAALPVTFLRFTAQQKNKDALLQWQAATETNPSYFIVQRSTDGIHFTDIGKAMPAGGTALQEYAYTDAGIDRLTVPNVWYRLAEQSNGGATTYSSLAMLSVAGGRLSVSISPNPVQNTILIYSPAALPGAVISLADMNGRILRTLKRNLAGGATTILDASQLAKGMYILVVESGTDREVFKIMK